MLSDAGIREELHAYLGGIAGRQDAQSVIVGGAEDHAHMLVQLGRTMAVADLVREVKRGSSKWIKGKGQRYQEFGWQSGYAALSVSRQEVPYVMRYIENQMEHHRQENFQDEYRRLLTECGIELDERYMWE